MPTYEPYKLFALVETAKDFGCTPEKILDGTHLNYEAVFNGASHMTVQQYLIACANAVREFSDPRLPIAVGKSLHLSAYGLYGFALLCSPSVRSGFEFAVRYHKLATPVFEIKWDISDESFIWTFPNEGRVGYEKSLHDFLIIQQLSQHVTHVKDIARSDRHPRLVQMTIAAPLQSAIFEEAFNCPVVYGAEATRVVYDMSILDDRPPLTNPVTYASLRRSCENLIGTIADKASVSGQVSRFIMESPAPFPSMDEVASKLAMTCRTLRRRLKEEGVSYSALLDEVRNKLAKKYLVSSSFSVEDISELLGFSDTANFRSSFKRWNGIPPGHYRKLTS